MPFIAIVGMLLTSHLAAKPVLTPPVISEIPFLHPSITTSPLDAPSSSILAPCSLFVVHSILSCVMAFHGVCILTIETAPPTFSFAASSAFSTKYLSFSARAGLETTALVASAVAIQNRNQFVRGMCAFPRLVWKRVIVNNHTHTTTIGARDRTQAESCCRIVLRLAALTTVISLLLQVWSMWFMALRTVGQHLPRSCGQPTLLRFRRPATRSLPARSGKSRLPSGDAPFEPASSRIPSHEMSPTGPTAGV